jgi:hypothetical protein
MASGFITLRNGLDWSHRWSGYDLVIEMIMDELSANGDEGKLKVWLKTLTPTEEDIESGWCFIRNSDHEMVARNLDTRFMKEEYLQIFWNALKRVRDKTIGEIEGGHVGGFLINQLYRCYESSLKDAYVNPDPFNPEKEELSDRQIGPGWY